MRLTLKLTIGLIVAILPVIAVNSGIRVRREIQTSEAEVHANDMTLGRTIAGAAAIGWRSSGEAGARALIDEANRNQHLVSVRWVWLDAPPGSPDAPRVPHGSVSTDGPTMTRGDSWFTYVQVAVPDGRHGAIEVQRSAVPEESFIEHTVRHAAVATGAVVGLCGFLALALGAIFVGRPVRLLVAQTRRIGAGDLSTRLQLRQHDELGQLGNEIDVMCDRLAEARDQLAGATATKLAALEQVRHADRLATVGKLAAGIAHEIGTPLNIISGHAQLIIAEHELGTADNDNAAIVVQQTQRVAAIIRQLLDFARRRAPRRARLELAPVVREALALLAPLRSERRLELELATPDDAIECNVDHGQLQQAVTNLVVNAIQSMGTGGRLGVTLTRCHATPPGGDHEGAYAKLEIRDDGHGIAADVLPHIFEPFFTTKDVGAGTGLGLSVTYGIVKDHDGWIDVASVPSEGSRFSMFLPIEPGATSEPRKVSS